MKRADGQSKFPRLSSIALLVLTIPHSNAEEERALSLIRKNKTAFRPNLDPNETLGTGHCCTMVAQRINMIFHQQC